MKTKLKKRMAQILALLLMIAMAVVFVPQMGAPVYADNETPAIQFVTDGTAENINGAQASSVWFGNYMQSNSTDKEPVKWRVLSNASSKLFLLADQNLDCKQYHRYKKDITWKDCTLRSWLQNDFLSAAFADKEQNAIIETEIANDKNPEYDTPGGGNTKDKVFLLSIDEVEKSAYGFVEGNGVDDNRVTTNTVYAETQGADTSSSGVAEYGWLRSPGGNARFAAIVDRYGYVSNYGLDVDYSDISVRPAFNLNLQSVLFTSAAVGGKSSSDLGKMMEVGKNANNEWKLTIHDASRDKDSNGNDVFKAFRIDGEVLAAGKTLKISYSGAKTGSDNEFVSAVITDSQDKVLYYGHIASTKASASGIATIDVPESASPEISKLYVFQEQCNGDKETDYSSKLHDLTEPGPIVSFTVTFKVKNGSWNDGTTADKTVTLSRSVDEDRALVLQDSDIPAVGKKPNKNYEAGSWDVTPSTDKAITKDTTYTYTYAKKKASPVPSPTPAKVSGTPLTTMTAKGDHSLAIAWQKVKGASGYEVFFARCDGKGSATTKKVKTIKGNKTFTWTKSGLKKGTAYKAYVKAYTMKKGKKKYVGSSPVMHIYTAGASKKYTNAKAVTVNKTKVNLNKGKTFQLETKVKKLKKGKKLMPSKHVATVRYLSTNKKIAAVTKKGKIIAKGKGTCYVYAYAHNGVYKKVEVTVK